MVFKMADAEVAFTTASLEDHFCISVWDLGSGMQLKSYKGGICSPRGLSLLGNQYLLAAQLNKPIIHVWNVAKEQMLMKLICPGKISSLSTSPDGHYCVVSCGEKIYIWQVATGILLVILSRHFQRVTCLRFVDSGTHFLSGGDDNLVMTWDLSDVLVETSNSIEQEQAVKPCYTWSDHALPVTDIYCGCGGMMGHVVTSSLDQTCKSVLMLQTLEQHITRVFPLVPTVIMEGVRTEIMSLPSLGSGELLCSFVFDCGITSVTTDPSEFNLYAGGMEGSIFQIHLYNPALKEENHVDKGTPLIFKGHNKQVNNIAVSMDGSLLLTGSSDCTARTWHVPSRQCTRTVTYKGPVTNAQILLRPPNLNEPLPRTLWPVIQPFKRHLQSSGKSSDSENPGSSIPMNLNENLSEKASLIDDSEKDFLKLIDEYGKDSSTSDRKKSVTREELLQEVGKLQKANQELYHFAIDKFLCEVQENIDIPKT